MRWVFTILGLVLLLGPLRKPFFRNWRFCIPASVAGYLSWLFVSHSMKPHDPAWMPWAVALLVSLGVGMHAKKWLDEVFGKEERNGFPGKNPGTGGAGRP